MADAGYRLTVDGEAEFKRALADINAQIKLNKSEINALTAEYNANGGSLDTLKQKQAALGTELQNQQSKVDTMRERLEAAKAAYGENSAQVVKLQTDLNNATTALHTIEKQYEDTQKQIEDATHSTADFDEAVKQADAAIAAEKAELTNISAAYKDADDKAGNLAKQQKNLTSQVEAQQSKIDALNAAMKTAADRYGAGSTEVQKYREQIAKAEGDLKKTKDALDKTTAAIDKATEAIEDQAKESDGTLKVLKDLTEQFGVKLPAGMDKMLEGFGNLAGPAGAMGLVGALAKVIEKMDEAAEAARRDYEGLKDLTYETGMSTAELEAWRYAADMLGVDAGTWEKAIGQMRENMYESADAAMEATKQFDTLGIAVQYTEGDTLNYNAMLAETDIALKKAYGGMQEYIDKFKEAGVELRKADGATKTAKEVLDEMIKTMWETEKSTNAAAGAFRDMGIDLHEANGDLRPTADVLWDVLKGLRAIPDEYERMKEAEKIFGSDASRLRGILGENVKTVHDAVTEGEKLAVTAGSISKAMDYETRKVNEQTAASNGLAKAWQNLMAGWSLKIGTVSTQTDSLQGLLAALLNWRMKAFGRQYARGTSYHPGGLALVGEQGPEIVDLPRGSAVYPSGTGPSGTTNYYITIDASRVREFNDIVRIAQNERVSRRMGVAQ